jgi:hypothetical protein
VAVSLGVKDKDMSQNVITAAAAAKGIVSACHFNMLSHDRPSALSTSEPFLNIRQHTSVEVTYQGKISSVALVLQYEP